MPLKANVTTSGAVILGEHVACDAFGEKQPFRVVTHAHHDHMLGLRKSLKTCEAILMTPATKDLISALKGPSFLNMENVRTINYGEEFAFDDRLELQYVDHILGAAQVLVEDAEGTRLLYTSDFRLPNTPIIEADTIVMEATYGNPAHVRPFEKRVEDDLISLVEQGLKEGTVYLFGYHGKIQEVMQILANANVDVPFIVPERVFDISEVCKKHGMNLGDCISTKHEDARVMLDNSVPCIAFYHMGSYRFVGRNAFRICVSGWEFRGTYRKRRENEFVIALSDHCDFNGLLQYVEESRPRLVLTDNFRAGGAEALAKEIQKRLHIQAKALPSRG